MKEFKYIIVRDSEGEERAIVFPKALWHRDVARIHRATDVVVVSAGFCRVTTEACDSWWAGGESDTLRMKSRPCDAGVIQKDYGDIRCS